MPLLLLHTTVPIGHLCSPTGATSSEVPNGDRASRGEDSRTRPVICRLLYGPSPSQSQPAKFGHGDN